MLCIASKHFENDIIGSTHLGLDSQNIFTKVIMSNLLKYFCSNQVKKFGLENLCRAREYFVMTSSLENSSDYSICVTKYLSLCIKKLISSLSIHHWLGFGTSNYCYSVIKKGKLKIFIGKWVHLETILLK